MLIQNPLDGSQSSGTLLVTKPERNYFKHIHEKILKKKKKKKKKKIPGIASKIRVTLIGRNLLPLRVAPSLEAINSFLSSPLFYVC